MAPDLSRTEWVVLALVVESPRHGFAIAKELAADTDLGRILTVHRPLVYRALDRLESAGLVGRGSTESDRGPQRVVMKATRKGKAALRSWLLEPVDHVRDLRITFLVKLRLCERSGLAAHTLIAAQQDTLAETLEHLAEPSEAADVVDLWRQHNAAAAASFLDELTADH